MLKPAEVAAGQLGRHYLQRYFLLIAFRCYLGANPVQVRSLFADMLMSTSMMLLKFLPGAQCRSGPGVI